MFLLPAALGFLSKHFPATVQYQGETNVHECLTGVFILRQELIVYHEYRVDTVEDLRSEGTRNEHDCVYISYLIIHNFMYFEWIKESILLFLS